MIDAADVVRDYLANDADLFEEISTRLWAEMDEPPGSYKPSDGAAIVFKAAGGGLQDADVIIRTRWQFKIYGPTYEDRRDAYLALVDALHNTRGRGGILSSGLEVPGTPLQEPDSKWDFLLTYFVTRMKSRLPIPV